MNRFPAAVGMSLDEVDTPCLLIDLDAFERNVETLRQFVDRQGVRLRAHAKTHKSADIARYQMEKGGACGICCQKVSEAEALVDAGIADVLITNQVVAPAKIERLAALAARARIAVCIDDAGAIDALDAAAGRHGATIGCLVEIDIGAGRCGVEPGAAAVELAGRIAAAGHLRFDGLQAYHGPAQHVQDFEARRSKIADATRLTADTVALLAEAGLSCATVGGAGTGTYPFEGTGGVYNELQCGSYIFMDADYGRIRDRDDAPLDTFGNALFLYTAVMSKTKPGMAVCDAGLKVQSVDSGMPVIHGLNGVTYVSASDEHGVIEDPDDTLKLNDRLMLIPGHCDPTVNVHDCFVCYRGDRVEAVWPVTARGMSF